VQDQADRFPTIVRPSGMLVAVVAAKQLVGAIDKVDNLVQRVPVLALYSCKPMNEEVVEEEDQVIEERDFKVLNR